MKKILFSLILCIGFVLVIMAKLNVCNMKILHSKHKLLN